MFARWLLVVLAVTARPPAASGGRGTLGTPAPPAPLPTANSLRPDLLPADCGQRRAPAPPEEDAFALPALDERRDRPAYPGQFPWQARLLRAGPDGAAQHLCSALIVTARHVLTAADCVGKNGAPPESLRVRAGDLVSGAREPEEQEQAVAEVHVYRQPGLRLQDNVALLRLAAALRLGAHVQPACLPVPGAGHQPFQPCEVAGWGAAATGGDALHADAVPLASDQFCSATEVFGERFVANRTLCTGPADRGGIYQCRGDPGAPLTCLDRAASRAIAFGLLADGAVQGCGSRPGVYAKLSGFVDWVLCHLRAERDGVPAADRPAACAPPTRPCGRARLRVPAPDHHGVASDPRQLPWMAVVSPSRQVARPCSGLILSDRWILTAAECAPSLDTIEVYLGRDFYFPQRRASARAAPPVEIDKIQVRPGRRAGRRNIALLRTRWKITFSADVSPICLAESAESPRADGHYTFAGLGDRSNADGSLFTLELARVQKVKRAVCQANYTQYGFREPDLGDDTLCTACVRPTVPPRAPTSHLLQGIRVFFPTAPQHDERRFSQGAAPPPPPCRFSSRDGSGVLMTSQVTADGARSWHAAGLALDGVKCCTSGLPDVGLDLAPAVGWIRGTMAREGPPPPPEPARPVVSAHSSCTTPDGEPGRCLRFIHCPQLVERARELGAAAMQRYVCGQDAALVTLACCASAPPRPPSRQALRETTTPQPATSPRPARVGCGRSLFRPSVWNSAGLVGDPRKLPWMAAVLVEGDARPRCAGAVLSERWVVAGATCAPPGARLTLRLGAVNPSNATAFSVPVAAATPHPDFGPGRGAADIALLRAAEPIPLSERVAPVCLPRAAARATLTAGDDLVLGGWGALAPGKADTPARLKWVSMRVVDAAACRANYSAAGDVDAFFGKHSFCTKPKARSWENICAVNSGDQSAVFLAQAEGGGRRREQRWTAVGLAVAGIGCSEEQGQFADINVALAPYVDWIRTVTGLQEQS